MTNLTEQWKKGELDAGWYYIELNEPFDKIHKDISYYSLGSFDIEVDSNYIIEVLAPVPSYEEWQASEKYNKHLEEVIKTYERKDKQATETSIAYNELAKENEELKEILERHKKATAKAQIKSCDLEIINQQLKDIISKMCMELVAPDDDMSNGLAEYFNQDLLLEINEALK